MKAKYEYILELKHIKTDNLSPKEIEEQKQKAIIQLEEYEQSKTILAKLIKIAVITSSKKVEFLGKV